MADENHVRAGTVVTEVIYQQWCQDFRSINEIFWRIPFIAMTLTGGIAFGAGTLKFSPQMQSALLYFLALCNLCFVVIVWRLRIGVMEPLLNRIYQFEGRAKPRMSYAIVATFTILFTITGVFSAYGALHRDLIFAVPPTSEGTAKSPP
jgi:hypothetical protein